MTTDLEMLREIFRDVREHVTMGVITQLGLSSDGSLLRVQIKLFQDDREVIAYMNFADCFDVTFPEVNDMALVAFADGNAEEAHIIKICNSSEEPIPSFAHTGHSTKYARSGKKLYLGSSVKVGLGRPNVEPASPLVLGDVLANCITAICNAITSNASNFGTAGGNTVVLNSAVTTALSNALSQYITTAATSILSQIAFTERGV